MLSKHANDSYLGCCPYHKSCAEGLCNNKALADRVGCTINELPSVPDDHEIWDFCAYYMAQLCVNLILISSPEHITLGGGILNRSSLFPKIRSYVLSLLNGYIENDLLTAHGIDEYITASYWVKNAGIIGAGYLALLAYESSVKDL
jgi:fructokinase